MGGICPVRILGMEHDAIGQNAIIARVQNSIGQILPSANQVLYTNAFDSQSDFQADILYTPHKKAGFGKDIILHEQPPSPAALGLNPGTTMLQVWTRFYNTADPDISTNSITVSIPTGPDRRVFRDEILKFGAMQMDQGHGIRQRRSDQFNEHKQHIAHWPNTGLQDNRRFLVEEVPLIQLLNNRAHFRSHLCGSGAGAGLLVLPGLFSPVPPSLTRNRPRPKLSTGPSSGPLRQVLRWTTT